MVKLLCGGRSNQEIASEMAVTMNTVKWYTGRNFTKLGVVRRTTQPISMAVRLGLADLN